MSVRTGACVVQMMLGRQYVSLRASRVVTTQLRMISKQSEPVKEIKIPTTEEVPQQVPSKASFLSLLRNSKLMQLGDASGKLVEGRVVHVLGDDIYVDWGGKFMAVSTRPRRHPERCVRGARVRLRLFDVELSSRFLGSTIDLTLLEADAKIISVISSPYKSPPS
ncbi:Ribosomal protein S28 mitochondrial [Trinorchestia longiramus]|nr:Ribosomal protein S28 mitochondrial [Trinorchestia longiramus]